jgi:hypothetical protein
MKWILLSGILMSLQVHAEKLKPIRMASAHITVTREFLQRSPGRKVICEYDYDVGVYDLTMHSGDWSLFDSMSDCKDAEQGVTVSILSALDIAMYPKSMQKRASVMIKRSDDKSEFPNLIFNMYKDLATSGMTISFGDGRDYNLEPAYQVEITYTDPK